MSVLAASSCVNLVGVDARIGVGGSSSSVESLLDVVVVADVGLLIRVTFPTSSAGSKPVGDVPMIALSS